MTTTSSFIPMRVLSVEHDTADSVIVCFETDLPFAHGQHLTLRRDFDGVEIRRSYSICSPAPDGELRVAIKHVPGGVFSTWANNDLVAGDQIDVLPPSGHFTHQLENGAPKKYTMLAAGSGITPVFSIMSTILAAEPRAQISLLYVNRTSNSTMLLDDLHDLRDLYLDRLAITFVFTREESGGELLSGRPDRQRLDQFISAGLLPADTDHAFMCGPIELVEDAAQALGDAGMSPDTLHREVFTTNQPGQVSVAPQDITESSVVVANGRATLNGRSTMFAMYDGDTVLDAVQRERPDTPFSCRSGVCSTCQAVIKGGHVQMDTNYGLSDDEVERGYILTCQSRPTTDQVEVDYDS